MIINFFVFATHQQLKFEEIYTFLTRLYCIEKGIELLVEISCYFLFMKRWINKTYRIETAILILLQSTLVVFLAVEDLEQFLKYGIISIQKLSSVVFLDSYILCLLIKEFHKKPLFPPIYIINSSLYITEIKLVYDSFIEFIKSQNNEEWLLLVNILMESQIIKYKNSKRKRISFEKRVNRLHYDLLEKISNFKVQEYDFSFEEIERLIIEYLDSEAFKKFMFSFEYYALEDVFRYANSKMCSCAVN